MSTLPKPKPKKMSPYRLQLGLVSLTLPREEGGEHQQGPEKEETQQIRCKDMLVHTILFPSAPTIAPKNMEVSRGTKSILWAGANS